MKGCFVCRRFPYLLRLTRRGFHVGWRGMPIDRKEMYRRRFIIGDDLNRIELDMKRQHSIQQVLFIKKKVYRFKYDGNNVKKELVSLKW
jgi:hypothetical protein